MSRRWKPGDVAVVAEPDSVMHGMLAMRAAGDDDRPEAWVVGERTWLSMAFGASSMRPVVVIDPEDRRQVKALHEAFNTTGWSMGHVFTDRLQAALRLLVAPPKPDEPTGLGAVVEDADGRIYTRYEVDDPKREPQPWWQSANGPEADVVRRFGWSDINAVRVLSEGVQPC